MNDGFLIYVCCLLVMIMVVCRGWPKFIVIKHINHYHYDGPAPKGGEAEDGEED